MPEFRVIIENENYKISDNGQIKNIKTSLILKGAISNSGYKIISLSKNGISKKYKVHRLVAIEFVKNDNNESFVDHIDGNKLNNHWQNLRWCTKQQNSFNRKKQKNCSSKYKGVCFRKQRDKYESQIVKDGKYIFLGSFKKEKDAAKAYNKEAVKLFGKFAKLNKFD